MNTLKTKTNKIGKTSKRKKQKEVLKSMISENPNIDKLIKSLNLVLTKA